MDKTLIYDSDNFQNALIEQTIIEVANSLKERGYNPINQIVGYLISGDPGYISSHSSARNKIMKFERAKILEVLVSKFLN